MKITVTLRKPRFWDYMSSCYRKVRYSHAQTAENAVRAMAAKGEPWREKTAAARQVARVRCKKEI